MGQLHEVLAVEPDLKTAAQGTYKKVKAIFGQEAEMLMGVTVTYHALRDDEHERPPEEKALPTTVMREMHELIGDWVRWIDASIQKEATNQRARADLVVGEETLLEAMPATALLNLEGKLAQLRKLFEDVPTNDVARRWEWDDDQGCYVSAVETKFRTRKVPRSYVLYDATKEHPAQVEMYHEDVVVGEIETVRTSGKISPARKARILARLDALIMATRKARQRANQEEVVSIEVGEILFDYVMG